MTAKIADSAVDAKEAWAEAAAVATGITTAVAFIGGGSVYGKGVGGGYGKVASQQGGKGTDPNKKKLMRALPGRNPRMRNCRAILCCRWSIFVVFGRNRPTTVGTYGPY